MYTRGICQIDKQWLKGLLQECVVNDAGDVVALTGDDWAMAENIAAMLNGLRDMVDGGRLTEATIPDDWQWLMKLLMQTGWTERNGAEALAETMNARSDVLLDDCGRIV